MLESKILKKNSIFALFSYVFTINSSQAYSNTQVLLLPKHQFPLFKLSLRMGNSLSAHLLVCTVDTKTEKVGSGTAMTAEVSSTFPLLLLVCNPEISKANSAEPDDALSLTQNLDEMKTGEQT